VRREYERLVANATPVEEYKVRHIMTRTREAAQAARDRVRAGESFAAVAADVSIDPGAKVNGGELGWSLPAHFDPAFGAAMVKLKPAGLAAEPTQTRFGWHLIEVEEVKLGKDSLPAFDSVKERIVAKLTSEGAATPSQVNVAAVCRRMVQPEMPAAAVKESISGTVVARMRIVDGRVTEVLDLSGPGVFHPAVTAAVLKYGCDKIDRPVVATQKFEFKAMP
jgi:peptidyl-prolyl cis-trans isomerase C